MKIAIFGAGGLGREISCLLKLLDSEKKSWDMIGFFDDGVRKGSQNEYGAVLGGMDELNAWTEKLALAIAIGDPKSIYSVVGRISNPKITFPNIISPDLLMHDQESFKSGKGNIIAAKCIISCNVKMGDFNLLNGNVIVGHDAVIGSYNAIMPSVNISGEVEIGDCNFLGVSSSVLQRVKVGNRVRISAGSVVIRKTQDDSMYLGNPAMKLKY